MGTCLIVYVCVSTAAWLLGAITRDYSWVDRIWSIIPVVYVAILAGHAGFGDARLDLMLVLTALWGARLTFNFIRKGGYGKGGEDYRWPILRSRMPGWAFQLFNFFFIAFYQNALLLLIALPAYTALQHRTPLTALDYVLAVLFLACLAGETVADQQQWNFHAAKHSGRTQDRFLTGGLFRYSRHPNFFFEQAQWWLLFLIGAVAARSLWQWTVLGAVLLTLLFVGSTRFTESISLSKYPEYADYQRRTSPVIPWRPRQAV